MGAKPDVGKVFFNLGDLKSEPPPFDHQKLVDQHGELLKRVAAVIAEMAASGDCRGITWFLQSISVAVNGAHDIFPELPRCKGCYKAGECGVDNPKSLSG